MVSWFKKIGQSVGDEVALSTIRTYMKTLAERGCVVVHVSEVKPEALAQAKAKMAEWAKAF